MGFFEGFLKTGESVYNEKYFSSSVIMKSFDSQVMPEKSFSEEEKNTLKTLSTAVKSLIEEDFKSSGLSNLHISLMFSKEDK